MIVVVGFILLLVGYGFVETVLPQRYVPVVERATVRGTVCQSQKQLELRLRSQSMIDGCRQVSDADITIVRSTPPSDYEEWPEIAAARAEEYTRRQIIDPFARLTAADKALKEAAIREAGRNAYLIAQEKWGSKTKLPITSEIRIHGNAEQALFASNDAISKQTTGGNYSPSSILRWIIVWAFALVPTIGFQIAINSPSIRYARWGRFKKSPRLRASPADLSSAEVTILVESGDKGALEALHLIALHGGSLDATLLSDAQITTVKECRHFQAYCTNFMRTVLNRPNEKIVVANTEIKGDERGNIIQGQISVSDKTARELVQAHERVL